MNCLLIGYGEIGKGVYSVFSKYYDISVVELKFKENMRKDNEYDIMLVTIPYSEKFIDIIKNYQKEYNPEATIIFSTVPIGTTSQIENAVHCPIEGKHPNLAESINRWPFFMGGWNKLAYKFFSVCKNPKILDKPEHTEFLKLQSTSNYGLMIEFARYLKTICDDIGMEYSHVLSYNQDYNQLYNSMNSSRFIRSLIVPPEGNIGGHCVVPNAEILDKQYPSIFLKEIYRDKEGEKKCLIY